MVNLWNIRLDSNNTRIRYYIATEIREWNVAIIIVLRTVSGASFLYLTSEDIYDERV